MIDIHTKNITLSEEQQERVMAKMEKLLHLAGKLQNEATKIRTEIDYDPVRAKEQRILCTVTIFAPQSTLRAETHRETVENAVDECEEKLRVQIEKYKAKKNS